jgi:IS30 family transposase
MSRPGGRRPRFTPADVEHMKSLRAAGLSAVKIAAQLGTSHSVVTRYLRGDCRHHDPRWTWPTMRKLTDAQVAEIRVRVAAGESLRSVARDYGVAFTTVRNAVRREYRQEMRVAA